MSRSLLKSPLYMYQKCENQDWAEGKLDWVRLQDSTAASLCSCGIGMAILGIESASGPGLYSDVQQS